jgi:hypothetical protein
MSGTVQGRKGGRWGSSESPSLKLCTSTMCANWATTETHYYAATTLLAVIKRKVCVNVYVLKLLNRKKMILVSP